MAIPILFHDPTSEPCRAVHWFTLEAGIELALEYTWLTRGEHRSARLLAVNPAHQVPALQHGDLCLSEASAIMLYLAELAGVQDDWVGATVVERAQSHRFLSWHHTNTRLKITLEYLLPVVLMPAYTGVAPPPAAEVDRLRCRGREAMTLLNALLRERGQYLGGARPSIADLFIAADLFELDADPDRDSWFADCPALSAWLDRLRERDGYRVSHQAWNAVVPRIRELLVQSTTEPRDPAWVADLCSRNVP